KTSCVLLQDSCVLLQISSRFASKLVAFCFKTHCILLHDPCVLSQDSCVFSHGGTAFCLLLKTLSAISSKDNEDPSWNTSFKNKRTKKTTSALEDFSLLYLYLLGTLYSDMMTLGPSFDYYRTSKCIVEGSTDEALFPIGGNIISSTLMIFECSFLFNGLFITLIMRIGSSFPSVIGSAFTLLLSGFLAPYKRWCHGHNLGRVHRVVPISPFFMLLSRAFSWSPILRFLSSVTIHESDWSAFRSYFLCLQPRVYFLHESIVAFRKLRGYEVYQIFYFESMYEAYYSLVFIEPVISGVSSVYLVIKPQTLLPSYLLMELIARVAGWSDELHTRGLCKHSWLPMVTRGVVICGLPSTSLSSSPVVTLADIMSVGDEASEARLRAVRWGTPSVLHYRGHPPVFYFDDYIRYLLLRHVMMASYLASLASTSFSMIGTAVTHSLKAAKCTTRLSLAFGAIKVEGFSIYLFISLKALSASLIHMTYFYSRHPFSVLKNGRDFSMIYDRNLLRAPPPLPATTSTAIATAAATPRTTTADYTTAGTTTTSTAAVTPPRSHHRPIVHATAATTAATAAAFPAAAAAVDGSMAATAALGPIKLLNSCLYFPCMGLFAVAPPLWWRSDDGTPPQPHLVVSGCDGATPCGTLGCLAT
nr:hypothetical protein [Tanacetum cinerariifolium]